MKLEQLQQKIYHTLEKPPLSPSIVIDACQKLSEGIQKGTYNALLQNAGLFSSIDHSMFSAAAHTLSADVLSKRLNRELGQEDADASVKRLPLGVLLHIGAGNVKGLGAYSVLEGLLTGNVNLLKPSSKDNNISKVILKELVQIEPRLKPYIYILSIPSSNHQALKQLAGLADGIVVWGGDTAIQAIRSLAGPDKLLIEWGNRFSFVYITKNGLKNKEQLNSLALHLLQTQQRFCSSCQAIFLEEGSPAHLAHTLNKQIRLLSSMPAFPLEKAAQNTLRCYTLDLKDTAHGEKICRAGGCPIHILSRTQIIPYLRSLPYALQTAGLICEKSVRAELSELFLRAGATRICTPEKMSAFPTSISHDGVYPLLRYTKISEISEEG